MNSTLVETLSVSLVNRIVQEYLTPSLEDTDLTISIKSYISSLPYTDQVLFILTVEGLPSRVIGAYLSLSHTTVCSHYSSIVSSLRSLSLC